MDRYHVLHIGPKNYPPSHGGVEKLVYDIIENMPDVDTSVMVEWEQPESKSVKVLPKGFFKQLSFIKTYLKEKKVDILHFHKETFIPHALLLSFIHRKSIVTIHGCAWRIKRWAWYYRLLFYMLDVLACVFIKKVVFVSKKDFQHFSKLIFWRKLVCISNGILDNTFVASPNEEKCVFIGRVSPEKNILGLLEMFKNTKSSLAIFGPFDKHEKKYKDMVMHEISSMANVKYCGVLNYDKILNKLSEYNTLCNISFSEGMPISVLEAASVGLNLVLSDIPQHRALNLTDSYYVNPHQPDSNFSFSSYSMSNKNEAISRFSIKHTSDEYFNLYKLLQK